jgi:hypothetical protein
MFGLIGSVLGLSETVLRTDLSDQTFWFAVASFNLGLLGAVLTWTSERALLAVGAALLLLAPIGAFAGGMLPGAIPAAAFMVATLLAVLAAAWPVPQRNQSPR